MYFHLRDLITKYLVMESLPVILSHFHSVGCSTAGGEPGKKADSRDDQGGL